MSGSQEKKAVPLSLAQEDVDRLTRGGKTAESVRRRLRLTAAARTTASKPRTDKACPQPISRKEMAAIVKRRVPSTVRERIASVSPSRIEAGAYSSKEKAAPTATPAYLLKSSRRRTVSS